MSKKAFNLLFLSLGLLFICAIYPILIDLLISLYSHKSVGSDRVAQRGTFGDMYGLLNTIFSGLALLGLVYTIREEKETKKRERLQMHKDKLSYFHGVLRLSSLTIKTSVEKFFTPSNLLKDDYLFYDHVIENYQKSNFERLNKILNSLNEEEYFLSYIENIDLLETYSKRSSRILILFETLHEILEMLIKLESIFFQSKTYIFKIKDKIEFDIKYNYERIETPDRIKFEASYLDWLKSSKSLFDIKKFIDEVIEIHNLNSDKVTSLYEFDFIGILRESLAKLMEVKIAIESDAEDLISLMAKVESEHELILIELEKINSFVAS